MLFCQFSVHGKYPFEKYPSIKTLRVLKGKDMLSNPFHDKNGIPDDTKYARLEYEFDNTKIQFTVYGDKDSSFIDIYVNNKLSQHLYENVYVNNDRILPPVKVADFNGDGIKDVKFMIYYAGCGLAALNIDIIYLFGTKSGKYIKVSYGDKEGEHLVERDWNGDGNAEIMTMELVSANSHNYWCYNVYNFVNGKMVCVNEQYDYPILIQYLYKTNYSITKHMTRQEMKKYRRETPLELIITQ